MRHIQAMRRLPPSEGAPRASRKLSPTLGVPPEPGRPIEPGSPDNVAVVSHDEWERVLGGRPLGDLSIWVGERQYQVIGVLPPEMKPPHGRGSRTCSGAGLQPAVRAMRANPVAILRAI